MPTRLDTYPVVLLVDADAVSSLAQRLNRRPRHDAAAPASAEHDRRHGSPKLAVPWFALRFLACVLVNSLHVLPAAATQAVNALDTFALTMAMTALGIETRIAQVRKAGPRALATGLILYVWLIVGGLAITCGVERAFG